ncbi:MAG: YegP family protein [Salinisphaeraceae bacterium]
MAGYFQIFKGKSDFRFRLKAGNHEIILQSEGYAAKSGAKTGVASVQKNSPDDARYDRRESASNYWFVLKAGNGEIIGKSEMYTTAAARDAGIESVKRNGPSDDVRDITEE